MEIYFLKSTACLAILLLFYKLLLEREDMHVFKRFYLLASVLASLIIPFITFTTYIEPASGTFDPVIFSSEAVSETLPINYWPYVLQSIYIAGVLFFGVKFFRNLKDLLLKIKKNERIKKKDITNVLLSEKTLPHTFFHYIFFNKKEYLHNEIPKDVEVHEEAHARQKHSYDVIFLEVLQIIFWLNPLIFHLKNVVKLNHEFLADRAVLKQGYATSRYQQTLLSYSSGDLQSDLVNPINYSSIKKRFTVMKTQTSQKIIWAKGLLLLPILALLLFSFSTKEIQQRSRVLSTLEIENSDILELSVDNQGRIFMGKREMSQADFGSLEKDKYKTASISSITGEATPEIIELFPVLRSVGIGNITICSSKGSIKGDTQKFATPEEIAEYNRLVKYYNEMPKERRVVKQEHANKIMSILSKMSQEQRENAEKINFDVPPPPPPSPEPAPAPAKTELLPLPKNVEVIGHPAPPTPPSPLAKSGELAPLEVIGYPSPPPPPPSPVESVQEWVEEGAAFFYNGKSISGKEALEIVQKNNGKNLSVHVEENNSRKTVRLSDKQ